MLFTFGIVVFTFGGLIDALNLVLALMRLRGWRQSGVAVVPVILYVIGAALARTAGLSENSYYVMLIAGVCAHIVCFGAATITKSQIRSS